ncbi:MAG: gamma-glutamyl-gamma-aminobutyrate hydrolase family protein [Candidatus Latescibacteria bacterium]|nr:gamma-glutamyl-gamma-aminobutyrate hydrolase family protein [Candidatus Latescibacterota bacterium]
MSRPWALIQHVPWEGPGTIAAEARECGIQLETRRMFAGDSVPPAEKIGGLIVMGGPMGAGDDVRHPHLRAERALLADAVLGGLPVLGVCLGAQLLAAALGARVYRGACEEVGFGEVELTPEGLRDPVLAAGTVETSGAGKASAAATAAAEAEPDRTIPVCHWHGDTFDLPRGAVHLARSALYPNQGFRIGDRVYGFQFHLELDRSLFEAWAPRFPSGAAMSAALQPAVERAGRRVFRKFFEASG